MALLRLQIVLFYLYDPEHAGHLALTLCCLMLNNNGSGGEVSIGGVTHFMVDGRRMGGASEVSRIGC